MRAARGPRCVLLAVLVALAVLGGYPARAWAESECASEAEQFGLAERLLSEADYFRAISEFKRYLFFFPHGDKALDARFGIADALLGAGRHAEAEAAFGELRAAALPTPWRQRALYGEALALLRMGSRSQGRRLLEELLANCPEPEYRDAVELQIVTSLAEEGEYREAERKLLGFGLPESVLGPRLAAVRQAAQEARSPALAGGLSAMLPGAGQLYCGRPKDAVLAVLVNGLFIWAVAEAGQRGNWPLTAGLGLTELVWYGGTVYGAVNCAFKQQRETAQRLREHLLQVAPQAQMGGWVLALSCRF
ncbi:MAG: hypothetical protein V2A77_06670 [Pseudomonadota bacterium]